ncbi:MAG TPA: hypothetical protein VF091_04340 [Gaiellaceae bacterium]
MTQLTRAGFAAVAAVAVLFAAGSASAAPNTGLLAVSFSPMTLGSSGTATIHVSTPQSDDSIAAVNIYTNAGIATGTPGTQIGSVDATAFAHDAGLNLPLSGPVTADDPAKHTTDACSPGSNLAVWVMNLSAAGQTLPIPIYINKTTGGATAFGAYNLKICLPPWDVPVGTPGRSFDGAQLLDAKLTVNKLVTAPTSAGLSVWEMFTTPYTPGKGTPNLAGTFESRALVPLPITLGIKATFKKSTHTWTLSGKASEGGVALPAGTSLTVSRGSSATSLKRAGTAKVKTGGAWSMSGKLTGKKPAYFQISAALGERDDTSTGCQSPAPATVAPAGCVSATLSAWSAKSAVVHVKP